MELRAGDYYYTHTHRRTCRRRRGCVVDQRKLVPVLAQDWLHVTWTEALDAQWPAGEIKKGIMNQSTSNYPCLGRNMTQGQAGELIVEPENFKNTNQLWGQISL